MPRFELIVALKDTGLFHNEDDAKFAAQEWADDLSMEQGCEVTDVVVKEV